jgi:hypothetical protein
LSNKSQHKFVELFSWTSGLDDDDEDSQTSFTKSFDLADQESHQLKVSNASSTHPSSTSALPNLLSDEALRGECTPSPPSSIRRGQQESPCNRGGSRRVRIAAPEAALLNLQEEVDQLMDLSIEIDSNKKIRNEHVHPVTLQFLRPDMESNVIRISTYIAHFYRGNYSYHGSFIL